MAPYPGNDLAVDPTERRAAIVASRMRNRRTGMGDVRASPNDQNGVIGMIGPDAPRPGVRTGDLNTGGYTAQKISQPVGPQSPYTAAPDSGGNRPTQEEGRTLRQMAEESMYGARSAARIARGRLFDLTKPGSVSSGAERAAGFAAVDDAKRVERNYEGDYNRLNNATKTLQSPETVAANRAELQRQFKMNTGGTGGRIPPDPRLDPAGFFTGNSAGEQVEKYPGAGQMAVRAAGANLNRQSLNAEQNRPRELAFDPLPSEAERRGPVDTTGPSAPEQMAIRLRMARDRAAAGTAASNTLADSETNRILSESAAGTARAGADKAKADAERVASESAASLAPKTATVSAERDKTNLMIEGGKTDRARSGEIAQQHAPIINAIKRYAALYNVENGIPDTESPDAQAISAAGKRAIQEWSSMPEEVRAAIAESILSEWDAGNTNFDPNTGKTNPWGQYGNIVLNTLASPFNWKNPLRDVRGVAESRGELAGFKSQAERARSMAARRRAASSAS